MTTTTTVPAELLDLACDRVFGTPSDPSDDRRGMERALAAVLAVHEQQVREQVAQELEARGKEIADEAAYKVAAGDDGGFSGVLRGASISWAAKFVRGEVTD